MKRNLESRVEVVTPVLDKKLCEELRLILNTQVNDQRSAWEMQPDGSFIQRQPKDESEAIGCQQQLILFAEKRAKQAAKRTRGKKRQLIRRNLR